MAGALVTDREDVIAVARRRAAAMADRDESVLLELLHPGFTWTSHTGDQFDLQSYVAANTHGANRWHAQELHRVAVEVVGDTAVLRCLVVDVVDVGAGEPETFRMPMTQTWVRDGGRWRCLNGHTGPRLPPPD